MKYSRGHHRLFRAGGIVGLAALLACGSVSAQEASGVGIWRSISKRVVGISTHGKPDFYLAVHSRHSRDTYSRKRLSKLNEDTWGIGGGWTLMNERGNEEALHLIVNQDSHRNLQWSAGYSHQWIFPVGRTGLHAGAGLSAVVIRREDWYDGVPFPALLPAFSIGAPGMKLVGSYVPRVTFGKGKGDVFMFLLRAEM